ncbi:MAG: hypothetical protein GX897_08900 [Clostridiales bacterium]|nr:hypothetical protein [Clostridiales bacterium]
MPALFDEIIKDYKIHTLRIEDLKLMSDVGFDVAKISCPNAVAYSEKLLNKPVPQLPATLYMKYYRDGNRSEYEKPYFERRDAAILLLLAELTEKQGRFTDLLIDYIWAILEESTWVIPAHIRQNHGNAPNCLPDAFNLTEEDDVRYVDLFSAQTGALLAWIWYLGGEILDPVTPVIRARILSMLKNRIFHVYYEVKGEGNGWMGDRGETLNNWTPWIVSNVLNAVMLCETDIEKRIYALERSSVILDRFTKDYPEDGGCDEGPGYWGVAGASYFDCLEIISDMTGGEVALFDVPFVKRLCEYIVDFNLCGSVYANFADASHFSGGCPTLLSRMGRLCKSDKLCGYAAFKANKLSFNSWSSSSTPYRSFKNLFEPYPACQPIPLKPETIFYPNLEVLIVRSESGLSLAAKGGHNAESHNHNDIGNFILFNRETPVFIDAGVEQYCKDTFSSKRYTLWTMRSLYHNLPEINGCEQLNGKQYHANIISCENGKLVLELKNAYPEEAGINSYIRSVSLNDNCFACTDNISLNEPGKIAFSIICVEEPENTASGKIRLNNAGVLAEYDEALSYSTDKIKLESKLRNEWQTESLTRIRLTEENIISKEYALTAKII